MKILVINAGSSSLKCQLIETDGKASLMKCLAEKVGSDDAFMNVSFYPDFDKTRYNVGGMRVEQVLAKLLDVLEDDPESPVSGLEQIDAVGNRIVAGMADATVVVESAHHGGALVTARLAQGYGRDVFAFPGRMGDEYSEGCNNLIRDNKAALITSADDLVRAMGWADDARMAEARRQGIERTLFPELTEDEQAVADVLGKDNDLQVNTLAARTSIPIGALSAVMFSLEMKGVVKLTAGGVYHLIKN